MTTKYKTQAFDRIDEIAPDLLEASHSIHAHPELCYKEKHACQVLCDVISKAGLEVEQGAYGIDTAFVARAGKAGPHIAILSEYDALKGIGHGCGHNIIGTAGVGAGLAASQLVDELNGQITLMGTPAEEGGGGKIKLLEKGAFKGIDVAIMLHPASMELTKMNTQGVRQIEVIYKGKPAHASVAPHIGINALDAAVIAQNSIAALRQHIRPQEIINGILIEGGNQVNVIPEKSVLHYQIRSDNHENLLALIPRAMNCFEAGALATGCEIEITQSSPDYFEMWDNEPLMDCYVKNAALLNRMPQEPDAISQVAGATDMGNVSQQVPSIHPLLKISSKNISLHTREFAAAAVSKEGDVGVLEGAKIMAGIAVDFWSDETLRKTIAANFKTQKTSLKQKII